MGISLSAILFRGAFVLSKLLSVLQEAGNASPHVVQRVVHEIAARGAWSAMTNAAHSKRSEYKKCKAPETFHQVLFNVGRALMQLFVQFV